MSFKYKRVLICWCYFDGNIWRSDKTLFEEIMNIEYVRKINDTKRRAYEYVEENKHLLRPSVDKKTLLIELEDTLKVAKKYKDLGDYEAFMSFVNGVIGYKKGVSSKLDYTRLIFLQSSIVNGIKKRHEIELSKEEDKQLKEFRQYEARGGKLFTT